MKKNYVILMGFITMISLVFSFRIVALQYFDVTIFSKEFALFLGLVLGIISILLEKKNYMMFNFYNKYPDLFWISVPAPILFVWLIYRELVSN
tara:strand:+ start:2192 stop:2470 length:279 start_codon:yes stop_codon:yes gene_type:complete